MKIRFLSGVALAVAMFSAPVEDAHAYGAIAAEHGTSNWAMVFNKKTTTEADAWVMNRCGLGCVIKTEIVHQCAARAIGVGGRQYALASTVARAKTGAINNCKTMGYTNCQVKASGCDTQP